ncbi:flagellar hook-associated protein FlgK [Cytobacillus oceanisediminis]|uniref:flagellar hook-associated protein FlgK n=1 Tax=Cytobacillus oceanisediminis TaxID=665099 RepID=UPI0011A9681D|nr:flagellar hook-associated protein FlgK [Cytobacillus oceanisediminis]
MRSTFMGLETARRGMFTQQSALHTTGHNIANANTPGYSRQRVNFAQTEPYPSASLNRPLIPGQVGTGVKAESVQRVREGFLDTQYRSENNKLGYWENRAEALRKMEEILNEPSEEGLSAAMDQFWQSMQDLAVNPMNAGARAVVRQRGIAVADTFNYLHNSLSAVQKDLQNEVSIGEKQINSLLSQLNEVNNQIGRVEPNGYLPNDLYDERDRLLDELSTLVNIKTDYVPSGGNALPIAEGKLIVKLIDDSGKELAHLLSAGGYSEVSIKFDGTDQSVKSLSVGKTDLDVSEFKSSGKLRSLIDSYGYEQGGTVKGIYPNMLAELDNLAYTFAVEFNKVHEAGMSPNEIKDGTDLKIPFFSDSEFTAISDRKGFAGRIDISADIRDSFDNIATADGSDPLKATIGDSSNALKLANVINQKFDFGLKNEQSDFRNYYEGVIGGMAVLSQESVRFVQNSSTLKQAVENKRQSVHSVSLDEEMSNMIQFQHAYNASARMITVTDEMLDKIINGMGVVGR